MEWIRKAREARGFSQRQLAKKAGVSFRTLQILEAAESAKTGGSGGSWTWDPKLSTVEKVLAALGYPEGVVERHLRRLAEQDSDAVSVMTEHLEDEENSWKVLLFNFVDKFRLHPDVGLIVEPPSSAVSEKIRALTASTVESLCREQGWLPPDWCRGVMPLREPWFPSGIENLKALALVESPADFRKRNIFVLGNFLERA